MKLSELSPTARKKVEALRYDRIIEKHEGPEDWSSVLRFHDPEFMRIRNEDVLLPIGRDQHENVTILRYVESSDGNTLTLFLKDTTYVQEAELEWWQAGFVAVCERIPREEFFVATVYHEWFIIDPVEKQLTRKAKGNGRGKSKN
jgi:hypothetical protein